MDADAFAFAVEDPNSGIPQNEVSKVRGEESFFCPQRHFGVIA